MYNKIWGWQTRAQCVEYFFLLYQVGGLTRTETAGRNLREGDINVEISMRELQH